MGSYPTISPLPRTNFAVKTEAAQGQIALPYAGSVAVFNILTAWFQLKSALFTVKLVRGGILSVALVLILPSPAVWVGVTD